jgi:hypothetical protein
MKHFLNRAFGLSAVALLLSGCYTQLAVVERPVPVYAANDSRIAERAASDEYFDEDSYREGYDDAVSDLRFRDYSRGSFFDSRDYELGYRDGYSDAAWDYRYYRARYSPSFSYWMFDPYYYHHSWAFGMHWNWYRYNHWYAFYGYGPYSYYAYPPYGFGGWSGYGYWGGVHPRHGWIIYYDHRNPRTDVHYGPRASGVSRDYSLTEPRARGVNRGTDRSVANTGRNSGVTRGSTDTRDRGTVTNSGRTTTTRGTTVNRPSTTGTRGTVGSTPRTTNRGSSGTVRTGNRPSSSGDSGSSGSRPRPNNRPNNNNDDDAISSSTTVVPRYSNPQPARTTPEVRVRQVNREVTRSDFSSRTTFNKPNESGRPSVGTTFPVTPSQGVGSERGTTSRIGTINQVQVPQNRTTQSNSSRVLNTIGEIGRAVITVENATRSVQRPSQGSVERSEPARSTSGSSRTTSRRPSND